MIASVIWLAAHDMRSVQLLPAYEHCMHACVHGSYRNMRTASQAAYQHTRASVHAHEPLNGVVNAMRLHPLHLLARWFTLLARCLDLILTCWGPCLARPTLCIRLFAIALAVCRHTFYHSTGRMCRSF